MKVNRWFVLTLLAGTSLGAAGMQALNAQVKSPVYVILDVSEVTDPVGWAAVAGRSTQAAAMLLKDFGGRYLVRTDNMTALDGTTPKRMAIIAFDSAEKAQSWYNSPAQKEVTATRLKTTKSRMFIVESN